MKDKKQETPKNHWYDYAAGIAIVGVIAKFCLDKIKDLDKHLTDKKDS